MAVLGRLDLQEEFTVYVLELPVSEQPEEGISQALALLLLRRREGLLLCVPHGYFSEETLALGLTATAEDQVGQSTVLSVAAGEVQDLSGRDPPVQVPGAMLDVVLVDVTKDIWDHLFPFNADIHDAEAIHVFSSEKPTLVPMVDAITAAAWTWISDPGSGERVGFYSALEEDTPATPRTPRAKRTAKAKAVPGTGGGDGAAAAKADPKRSKPTVNSLASSLDSVNQTLPQIMEELRLLRQRADAMEGQMATNPSRPSALKQPLGDLTTAGLSSTPKKLASFLDDMPPPRSSMTRTPTRLPGSSSMDFPCAAALEKEKEDDKAPDLTRAILAQSQALSTLVQQMATGDLGIEGSSSSGMSTKGAQGRARLQQELALHRGTFFNAVYASMARRMQPSQPADMSPMDLGRRGVVASHYVERFGGYGRSRDLGHIMWQVALILDHLQNDNIGAAKDSTALLAVCLEQAALDSGRMDIGLLLALQEDPPAGVFTNRNLAGYARGKAFAPLADQKWVTNALSYIKELDLIVSKRTDATAQRTQKEDPSSSTSPKRAPKKHPKGSWKKKGDQQEEGEQ